MEIGNTDELSVPIRYNYDVYSRRIQTELPQKKIFLPTIWNPTIHCVSKNDTDVAHFNFVAHQLILVILGRGVAERVRYRSNGDLLPRIP